MIKFRNLNADELEVRSSECKGDNVSLLIYKDSRVDMRVLDETVGNEDWDVQYKREGDTLLCGLGIYSEKHNRFVYKWAAGSESNFEAVKGEQSDALKRAAFCWGIGRALYTAPKIYVPKEQAAGKCGVSEIEYSEDGSRITALKIVNGRGNVIFNYPGGANTKEPETAPKSNKEKLTEFCSERKEAGDDKAVLKKFYDFYLDKCEEFTYFSPRKLYDKWVASER